MECPVPVLGLLMRLMELTANPTLCSAHLAASTDTSRCFFIRVRRILHTQRTCANNPSDECDRGQHGCLVPAEQHGHTDMAPQQHPGLFNSGICRASWILTYQLTNPALSVPLVRGSLTGSNPWAERPWCCVFLDMILFSFGNGQQELCCSGTWRRQHCFSTSSPQIPKRLLSTQISHCKIPTMCSWAGEDKPSKVLVQQGFETCTGPEICKSPDVRD